MPNSFLKILIGTVTLLGLEYTLDAIHVPKLITKDDIEILKLYNSDKECLDIDSYNKEIKCIKKIQLSQLKLRNSQKSDKLQKRMKQFFAQLEIIH